MGMSVLSRALPVAALLAVLSLETRASVVSSGFGEVAFLGEVETAGATFVRFLDGENAERLFARLKPENALAALHAEERPTPPIVTFVEAPPPPQGGGLLLLGLIMLAITGGLRGFGPQASDLIPQLSRLRAAILARADRPLPIHSVL